MTLSRATFETRWKSHGRYKNKNQSTCATGDTSDAISGCARAGDGGGRSWKLLFPVSGKYAWLAIHLFTGYLGGVAIATNLVVSGGIVKLSNGKIRKYSSCLPTRTLVAATLPDRLVLAPVRGRGRERVLSPFSRDGGVRPGGRVAPGGGSGRLAETGKVVRATEGT